MTQQYGRAGPSTSPPSYSQESSTWQNDGILLDPSGPPCLPPGWQEFRDENNRRVFFHKESQKMECNIDDLFKKEPPMMHYDRNRRQMAPDAAGIRPAPASPHTSTPAHRQKKTSSHSTARKGTPRPDAPKSSYLVTSSPLIIRVPGVVDLVSTATEDEDD